MKEGWCNSVKSRRRVGGPPVAVSWMRNGGGFSFRQPCETCAPRCESSKSAMPQLPGGLPCRTLPRRRSGLFHSGDCGHVRDSLLAAVPIADLSPALRERLHCCWHQPILIPDVTVSNCSLRSISMCFHALLLCMSLSLAFSRSGPPGVPPQGSRSWPLPPPLRRCPAPWCLPSSLQEGKSSSFCFLGIRNELESDQVGHGLSRDTFICLAV